MEEKEIDRRILQWMGAAQDILDVGCGGGRLVNFLAHQTQKRIVGLDISNHGFAVLAVHDLQAIFGAKGFRHELAAVVEICNEPFGSQMLAADPQMSLMMPCKIAVYVKAGQVHISALRPRLMAEFMPQFAPLVEQGDAVMCRIVDEAC